MSHRKKSQKQLQIGEQVKREIANIFLKNDIFAKKDLKVTVKEADVSPDLKNIKIFISLNNDDFNQDKLVNELNVNNMYFQKIIAKSMRLRLIPKILFTIDNSMSYGQKISKLISEEGSDSSK